MNVVRVVTLLCALATVLTLGRTFDGGGGVLPPPKKPKSVLEHVRYWNRLRKVCTYSKFNVFVFLFLNCANMSIKSDIILG